MIFISKIRFIFLMKRDKKNDFVSGLFSEVHG